jgi:putative transposase
MKMAKKSTDNSIDKALDLLLDKDTDTTTLFKEGGLFKQLTKAIVERSLKAEMSHHLGYEKHEASSGDNFRNGTSQKSLITENGTVEIDSPRDRNGSFEPALLPKRKTIIDGLDQKILALYSRGMSISDIKAQLKDLYGAEICESLISKITDSVLDEVKAWQNRGLDKVYPIVYFDCLFVKVRDDHKIKNKAVYVALGVDINGIKDILGLWISENEGAKFWLGNLTELKNRGVKDILIACTDNLKGMNEAIEAAFPYTKHQLCIVHQIRNSLKYVSYKDRKSVAQDLKSIYTAATENDATRALEVFEKKWDKQYPQISKSWYNNWENLVGFLEYPQAIRRVIYTTNAIESFNSQLRKVTKNKRVFPNDNSVFKTLYLAIENITKKWSAPMRDWKQAMAYFLIEFEDRLK